MHGAALRLGWPSEEGQGGWQIWEHGLLLDLDQGGGVAWFALCQGINERGRACSGVKGQDGVAVEVGAKGENHTLFFVAVNGLLGQEHFMVRHSPRSHNAYAICIFCDYCLFPCLGTESSSL